MNRDSLKRHLVEGPVTYDFALHSRIVTALHDVGGGLGTAVGHVPFRLSKFHGHGSWPVCEVAQLHPNEQS
jgi:hypothetical protein